MRRQRRSNLAIGLILILVGAWFLAVQVFPNLRVWFNIFATFLGGPSLLGPFWPVLIILLGLWLIVRPLFRR
jgi:hypothetical protein